MSDYTLTAKYSRRNGAQPTGSLLSYGLRIRCEISTNDTVLAIRLPGFLKRTCRSFTADKRTLQVEEITDSTGENQWSFSLYMKRPGARPRKKRDIEQEVKSTMLTFVSYLEDKLKARSPKPAFKLTVS